MLLREGTSSTRKENPMSLMETVEGTLKPDGTLELDQKPSMQPGRVTVTLQPLQAGSTPERRLTDVIDQIRREQQARGFQGRSAREIEAGLREGEAEYEQRAQTLRSLAKSGPQSRSS